MKVKQLANSTDATHHKVNSDGSFSFLNAVIFFPECLKCLKDDHHIREDEKHTARHPM